MPILNPQQKAALVAELAKPAYSGLDDARATAALNAPASVPNPTPQAQVPKPFLTRDLMGLLDAAAIGKLQSLPSLARLLDDIAAQVPGPLDNWIALLQAGGTITPAQGAALAGVVHATQPDPAWRPTVPGPSPFQALFPGVEFRLPGGGSVKNQAVPAIVAEARS